MYGLLGPQEPPFSCYRVSFVDAFRLSRESRPHVNPAEGDEEGPRGPGHHAWLILNVQILFVKFMIDFFIIIKSQYIIQIRCGLLVWW